MATLRKVKFSLRYKIAILIFVLIIITMGATFYYSLNLNISIQKKDMQKSITQITTTIGALRLVMTQMQEKDVNWAVYDTFMSMITNLDKNILLIAILDTDGTIKAKTINTALIKSEFPEIKIDDNADEFIKTLVNTKINYTAKVTQNITIKGTQLSPIIIKFSMKDYYRRRNMTIFTMIGLTVLLLLFGLGGAWMLADIITKAFNIIAAGMRKVAEGNLDVSVNVKSNDEVGVLADDFNRMIVELKEKVRIKDAFDTVAEGLKEIDSIKKAYEILAYQEMTDKMAKNYYPSAEGDENRTIFVFIDTLALSNFTFELVSEEMKEILKKFVEKVSAVAINYQGAIFKVTERFILISFGYPFRHEDDAKRALISTVEIRKELVNMVKSKLTLGYTVEDFKINFIISAGNIAKNFIDKLSIEKYNAIVDYLGFASKYGEKKKYSTDIFATKDIAGATDTLAKYDRVDAVVLSDGTNMDIFKLTGTKF